MRPNLIIAAIVLSRSVTRTAAKNAAAEHELSEELSEAEEMIREEQGLVAEEIALLQALQEEAPFATRAGDVTIDFEDAPGATDAGSAAVELAAHAGHLPEEQAHYHEHKRSEKDRAKAAKATASGSKARARSHRVPAAEGPAVGHARAKSAKAGDGFAPAESVSLPVYATKSTVTQLHGTVSKSIYDPPTGNTHSQTCNAQGRERGYACIGDRLGNAERLARGTVMCSRHGRYMFGMDGSGSLVWRDCFDDVERVYYKSAGEERGNHFVMGEDAAFLVSGDAEEEGDAGARWRRECKFEVRPTRRCLEKPTYDCPYLHLHKGGTLVLNWIEDGGGWKSRGVDNLYAF